MKRIIITIAMILTIIPFLSSQQMLDSYLQMAAQNNPGLKAKFSQYMAALEVVPQVGTLPDPQIAFAYFIQPVETRVGPQQLKVSASQMFPWFGTLKSRKSLASQNAKVKYEHFLEAKAKLYNDVRFAYYNLYFNNRSLEITAENIEILKAFQKIVDIKIEAGKVSAVDGYRIEMEIGDLENQQAYLTDLKVVLEVSFRNLLNGDDTLKISIPDTLWNLDLRFTKSSILDSIYAKNHQLVALSLQHQAFEFRRELAKKAGKPSFLIGMDYIVTGQGENNLTGIDPVVFPKVGLTIPLYRNKYRSMVSEVINLQDATEYEISDRSNMLETLLENTLKEYKDADRRIKLYIKQLDLAKKSLKVLETDYSTGSKNFEEILRMERKVLQYGLELERARTDKQAAIAYIEYLMGK